MKKILTLLAFISFGNAYSQCTLQGLNSFYCTSDTGSQLTASCSSGTPTIFGSGVNSSGYFNPAGLQDSVPIIVLQGTTTYTVSQQGTSSPEAMTNATSVSLGDDQVSGALNIGFTFRYFDNSYTQFYISSNGFITFTNTTSNGCCSGQFLPSTIAPNNLVTFVWEDFNPGSGGTISYKTVGTAPNRRCLIDFNSVPHFGNGGGPMTSQIKLYEGCGLIEIHTTSMITDGGSHTQGIENLNGTAAYFVSGRNAASFSLTNDYVSFQPNCGDTFWTYVSDGPTLTMSADSNNCFFDTTATASVLAAGEAPFAYEWSNGATTSTVTSLGSGTFTVTVTDNDGCFAVGEVDVYSPSPLGVNTNQTNVVCESDNNGTATATANGGTPPYAYVWSNGATTNTISGLDTGSYSVTITDAGGCTTQTAVNLGFQFENPIVNLGPDKFLCPGKIALLVTAPGYASYVWSTGDSVANIVVNAAGTYTVTVTASNGCSGSDEITVIGVLPVQVDLGPDKEGLAPIQVDAGSQFNQFLWSTGSNNQIINVGVSGTYTVTVADSNGCSSSDAISVSIWPSGVEELGAGDFAVFPNPASDVLSIVAGSTHNNLHIELIDISGRTMMQQTQRAGAGEVLQLDVSTMPKGTYLLRMHDGGTQVQRTIVLN